MGEPSPSEPDARRVLEEDRRSRRNFITRNLLGYCFKRTRDRARAEDATQEAITLVLAGKGWHRWVHDDGKSLELSLLDHLSNVAKDVLKKDRERAAGWREIPTRPVHEAKAADPQARPDDRIEDHAEQEEEMRLAQLVVDRLDDRTRAMLELEQEGIHDAAVLASRLECTVKEVYRMRERVAYHRDRVLEEERGRESEP